jgi:hypothetical protein
MVDPSSFGDAGNNRRKERMNHTRSLGAKTTAVAIFGLLAAAFAVCGFIFAFAIRPPGLAWLGFAIVVTSVLCVAALVPVAFERTRVSPPPAAHAADKERRLLVIADSHCRETALCDEIMARLDSAAAVHVVVPVRVSHMHFMADDEAAEYQEAEQSLQITVDLLQQRGIATTGSVGSDKPLESMADALASFAATQVLLVTPPEQDSYWLEHGLLEKARKLTVVPTTQVVVPTRPTAREQGAARV